MPPEDADRDVAVEPPVESETVEPDPQPEISEAEPAPAAPEPIQEITKEPASESILETPPPSHQPSPDPHPVAQPKDLPGIAPERPHAPVKPISPEETETNENAMLDGKTAGTLESEVDETVGGSGGAEEDSASETDSANKPESQTGQVTSSAAGNAAEMNYAGEVMRHLSRVRRPRASSPGSAFVSFTLTADGHIEDVSISQRSGSGRFDRDAINVVKRAAPYPEPPLGVNRTFVVEIEGQ